MLPRNTKRLWYVVVLIALSVLCSTAVADSKSFSLFSNTVSIDTNESSVTKAITTERNNSDVASSLKKTTAAMMFATIVGNADETVGCSENGFTIARYNLCGDYDDRTIALTGGPYGSYTWQQFNPSGSCTFDVNEDCPNTNTSCWTTVSGASNFTIDASAVSSSTGAEFRVSVNGGSFYYIKVKKSTITQTYVKKDYICGVDGEIQITNISAAYELSINGGLTWQDSKIFSGLAPGTYNIIARKKDTPNACEYPYEPIVIEQRDIAIDVTYVDANCFGDTGSITVNVNNVPGPYKYTLLDESGVPQEFTTFIATNPYTFSAVGFGTYSVQVETQQCTGDPMNGIPAPRQDFDTNGSPITIGDGLVALGASTEVNSSLNTDCGVTDVDIIVRTNGGAPPYTFTVSGGGSSATSYTASTTYNVTAAGDYDFLITDSNGCTITASATVEELTPPDVTATGTDGTCSNGGAKINFNVLDAKGYNLSYRATSGDPWSTNPILSVPAGTYNNLQVRYQQGTLDCIYNVPGSVTVTSVGTIVGNAVKLSDRTCNGSGGIDGGSIEFQGPFSGGSGSGYVFSISGDAPANFTTQTLYTNLAPGTYTPIIRDSGGCRLELTPITILEVDPPTDLGFTQTNINCTAQTSDVQLTATSNAAIATYEIISPVAINNGANDTFVGLDTNTVYEFRITDVNGCSYTESFSPAIISSIRARVKSGGDLRVCNAANDGEGTFIIDGFANNYTYNINGGTESAPQSNSEVDLTGLAAGTYVITVTDADSGCTDTASITVDQRDAISLTGTVTPMSCDNGNQGRVVANATDGWGGYRYTLTRPDATTVGPQTGTVFGGLNQAGSYTLEVEDSEGCTDTFTFSLTPLSPPTIALDAATDYCYNPSTGATIVVTASGGNPDSSPNPPYQFRINGGALQSTGTFTNVSPGTYTVEVVDGSNCRDAISVTIRPQLRVLTNITAEIPCGGSPGEIRVRAQRGYLSGSSKTYEVSSDNGATFSAPVTFTSNTFFYNTTTPGDYIFRVTDNEGCVAESSPITLDPPQNIDPATVDVTPASCGETDNGMVVITPDATSGIPPYEVNFDGAGWSSQTVYSNLNAGQTYSYIVRDARGCETVVDNFTVPASPTSPPDAAVSPVTATCASGTVEGSIDITGVTGGLGDFTYILQDQFGNELDRIGPTSSTTETFTNIAPGEYTILTIDSLGCSDIDTVTVDQTTVDVVPDPVASPVCGPSGFSNTVEIFGGTGPFLIRLVGDPSAPVSPNIPPRRHTFNNLLYGVAYTVEVTDTATGCIYEDEIPPINGPSSLAVTAASSPGYCDANRFGEINYEITGYTIGDVLEVLLFNSDDGSTTPIETVTTAIDPYANTYNTLPGNYQIIVNNLTDNCNTATAVTIDQNLPDINIISEEPANCNAFGQITVRGYGGNGGPYTYAYMPAGTPPTPGDYTTETTFIGPAGNYDVYVQDSSGCTSFDIATIISLQPDLVAPGISVVNQCVVTATSFEINVTMPSTVDTPRFTLGGVTQIGVLNGGVYETTFFVNSPGTYTIDVQDANGCTSQGTADVYEFLAISGDFTTIPTCFNPDGTITMEVTGGSNQFSYQLRDSGGTDIGAPILGDSTAGIFTGIAAGDYQVYIEDTETGCDDLVTISLAPPTPPVIDSVVDEDISCNGSNDGTIDVLMNGASVVDTPLQFTLYNAGSSTIVQQNGSGSFANLSPGNYDVVVVTARGCEDRVDDIAITEPPVFEISASAPDFTCSPGANRFSSTIITVTEVQTGTPGYQYSITGFENYQTSNTFEIIDDGTIQTITVYAIDGNGCQDTFEVTINPPTEVVPSILSSSPLTCAADEIVTIHVDGTTNYEVEVSPAVPGSPFNSGGNADTQVLLPTAGEYIFIVNDLSSGCSYPMPRYTVVAPIEPEVVISEAAPVQCDGDSNGALFIEVTDYSGNYSYEVFAVDNGGVETTTGITGTFDTANFPDVNGDPARITGLSGGNFIVRIQSIDDPQCPAESNLATIRTPNGPLDVTATEIGNVSCNDNVGSIEAIGSGGWDSAAYEYRLMYDDDADGSTPMIELVTWSATRTYENLSSGDYTVEIRDIEGCSDSFNITLDPIDPIQAGIREPAGLVCPGGNNAILEAYDLTSGDATTATAGASGGVPGAGYKYQLIYLGSNDILDELSRSGLQDSPTFGGSAGGGYISAGWYAIEISSSFECVGVTVPYYVDPPPPIIPNLVQVQAPGCGGLGQMRLRIENPEAGFEYEYRISNTADPVNDPFTSMGAGVTSVIIDGGPGFYQYDVRKVNGVNTCDVVTSNGLTLVDAQDLDLVVNQPDDISCSSEIDGRIESFSSGGVGNNNYMLFLGDPGDPYNPNASATLFMGPQANGTFEGLPEGTEYYVAVTSGVTCSDVEGPFVIVRPEPIVYDVTATNVTCSGETDGTITVEVTSGGEGLVQFAIGPNFNEFFSDPDTPNQYTFTDLEGSTGGRDYEILIQDAQGCSESTVVTIYRPTEIESNFTATAETCMGFADGTAQLTITGGTPFVDAVDGSTYYETSLNSNNEVDFVRNDSLLYENLEGGQTYVVFIRDAMGCQSNVIVTIPIGVDLSPTADVAYGCDGIFPNSTVTVDIADQSQMSRVLFSLDVDDIMVANTDRVFGDLPAGDHTVYVYHENGCATFVEFTVDGYEPLTLVAEKTGPNEITAMATGGFGGYEYFFQGDSFGDTNIFTINEDATINIRVEDQNGCVANLVMPFDFDGMLEPPNFFTPDGDNMNDTWYPKNRELFANLEVKIYDRYGRVVAVLDQVSEWDGTYEGTELPSGDYWYVVNANDKDKQQYVGHFTLYR